MSLSLGGSLFVHNAIKYDYCVAEAVESLVPLCDEVVALDAQSDDGTIDILRGLERKHGNLKVYEDGVWECAPDKERLSMLANEAKNKLTTRWHFMLQADEVLHESSFEHIREALEKSGAESKTWAVKRLNLYGDYGHYIKEGSKRKPCNDYPNRLGRVDISALGDAESLQLVGHSSRWQDKIVIFHYGFVRKFDLMLDRILDVQSWFFGPDGRPDPRAVKQKATTGFFDPEEIIPRSEYKPLYMDHPKVAKEWVREREALLSMRTGQQAQGSNH